MRRLRASASRNRSDPAIATARCEPRSMSKVPSVRTPIGRTKASGWSGRRSQSVGAASVAARTASTTGRRGEADTRRGGRLNGRVPSCTGRRCGHSASEGAGLSSWNAREPTVRVPVCHGLAPSRCSPSIATSEASGTTDTSDIVPVASTTSSNVQRSTGATSSSLALERRPGPIRYRPGASRIMRPAPCPATWTSSTSASETPGGVGAADDTTEPTRRSTSSSGVLASTARPSTTTRRGTAWPVTAAMTSPNVVVGACDAIDTSASPWGVRTTMSIGRNTTEPDRCRATSLLDVRASAQNLNNLLSSCSGVPMTKGEIPPLAPLLRTRATFDRDLASSRRRHRCHADGAVRRHRGRARRRAAGRRCRVRSGDGLVRAPADGPNRPGRRLRGTGVGQPRCGSQWRAAVGGRGTSWRVPAERQHCGGSGDRFGGTSSRDTVRAVGAGRRAGVVRCRPGRVGRVQSQC
jgi:hypothetical protein